MFCIHCNGSGKSLLADLMDNGHFHPFDRRKFCSFCNGSGRTKNEEKNNNENKKITKRNS